MRNRELLCHCVGSLSSFEGSFDLSVLVQIGCRKSLYGAHFTPKVGVFNGQLLNSL